MDVVKESYEKSIGLLQRLSTGRGFAASLQDVVNYKRVWSRDGVISGLAALQSGEADLIKEFEATLETLKEFQDHTGRIPSNVKLDTRQVSYGTTVGRIDATLWYVIGVTRYLLSLEPAKRDDLSSFFTDSLRRADFYLQCLELNGRGLLYIPQGGDWADEYINHGYVLYDQALYYLAQLGLSEVLADRSLAARANRLKQLIQINYFPSPENKDSELVYHPALFVSALRDYKPPLPMAYFSNHSVRYHLDTFAVSLLKLAGIVSDDEYLPIAEAAWRLAAAPDFPILAVFHPPITEADSRWPHLQSSPVFSFRNQPGHYHNGGRWPLVHGFFLSSVRARPEAADRLKQFAGILQRDSYAFPEYYQGQTYEADGISGLAFSAAAYVLAHQSITKQQNLFS